MRSLRKFITFSIVSWNADLCLRKFCFHLVTNSMAAKKQKSKKQPELIDY